MMSFLFHLFFFVLFGFISYTLYLFAILSCKKYRQVIRESNDVIREAQNTARESISVVRESIRAIEFSDIHPRTITGVDVSDLEEEIRVEINNLVNRSRATVWTQVERYSIPQNIIDRFNDLNQATRRHNERSPVQEVEERVNWKREGF